MIESADAVPRKSWHFWAIFPALGLSAALTALDATVISTVLPTIVDDLALDVPFIWLLNSYTLSSTVVQPLYGQAANSFGRKGTFITAIALFFLGSGMCGGARDTNTIIAGRVVQGLGAGGISILPSMIICDLVPLRERQNFQGIVYGAFAIGTDLGPVIGGILADGIGWRWVFWINLPISGASILLIAVFLQVNHGRTGNVCHQLAQIDFVGNAILTASISSILLALSWAGSAYPWSSWRVIFTLGLGFFGLACFLFFESSNWCREPTMPLRLFQNQTSAIAYLQTFLHGVLLYWVIYFLPVYFQAALRASPQQSGVYILASMVPLVPFGIVGGAVIARTGRYKPNQLVGFALMTIGIGCLTLLDQRSSKTEWVVFQLIYSAGTGILMTAFLPAIQAPLAEGDVGVATATWGLVQSFGYIWGGAIPSSIFDTRFNTFLSHINDEAVQQQLANGGAYQHVSGSFIGSLSEEIRSQVVDAYVMSLKLVWQACIAFAVAAFVASVFIKEVRLREELETKFGYDEKSGKRIKMEDGAASFSKELVEGNLDC